MTLMQAVLMKDVIALEHPQLLHILRKVKLDIARIAPVAFIGHSLAEVGL